MNPETTPQRLINFSSPLDRLVFIVTVSPETLTSTMLSYHADLGSGTPKMSARYFLMTSERNASVIGLDFASLISWVNLIKGLEPVILWVLADANRVKKSTEVKTGSIEKTAMTFMLSIDWIAFCILMGVTNFAAVFFICLAAFLVTQATGSLSIS